MLRVARQRADLSLRELAHRAGTSHATLLAYESERKNPSARTFQRIIEACGFTMELVRSRRIREADGVARGRELEEALDLAAQFPARHRPLPPSPFRKR
jgi:transcriptional regulator with XRE-family HTH domain